MGISQVNYEIVIAQNPRNPVSQQDFSHSIGDFWLRNPISAGLRSHSLFL